jgi:hypothetical protein
MGLGAQGVGTADGTVSGATYALASSCKINTCMKFTNSTDYVSAGDIAWIDMADSATWSFWINPTTLTADRTIISKSNFKTSGGQNVFAITIDHATTSEIRVYIAGTLNDISNYFTTSGLGLTNGTWAHIVVVYDGYAASSTDIVKVYKNGRRITSSLSGNPATMVSLNPNSTSNFKVGASDGAAPYTALPMYLDEFRFYSGALTETEILADYNAGSAVTLGGVYGTHDYEGFGGNPPVGYWKMDENQGAIAYDSSGTFLSVGIPHDQELVLTPPYHTWLPGKFGSALHNTNTAISSTNNTAGDFTNQSFTASLWYRRDNNTNSSTDIIRKKPACNDTTAGYCLLLWNDASDGNLQLFVADGTHQYNTLTTTFKLTPGIWYHLEVVFDRSNQARSGIYVNGQLDKTGGESGTVASIGSLATSGIGLIINSGDSAPYIANASIDEVKLYDYARSPAQIAYDYNGGNPVGWWKFDECSGTTAHDSSGNGNNGTITPNAGRTAGTCGSGVNTEMWNGGTTGKYNASLKFDGVGDYVQLASTTRLPTNNGDSWTISAWVNPTAIDSIDHFIAGWGDSNTAGRTPHISLSASNKWRVSTWGVANDLDSASTPQSGVWTHVVGVFDGTNEWLYINGKLDTGPKAVTSNPASTSARIGRDPVTTGLYWKGLIDEVKIYNYALTATQIKTLYNGGSAILFAPLTGTP